MTIYKSESEIYQALNTSEMQTLFMNLGMEVDGCINTEDLTQEQISKFKTKLENHIGGAVHPDVAKNVIEKYALYQNSARQSIAEIVNSDQFNDTTNVLGNNQRFYELNSAQLEQFANKMSHLLSVYFADGQIDGREVNHFAALAKENGINLTTGMAKIFLESKMAQNNIVSNREQGIHSSR